MSLAVTAFNQIVIMFLLILVGIFCYKVKIIDQEMNRKLSNLVLLLVNPLVILVSYQRKFEASLLRGLLLSLILAILTHFVGIILSMILLRHNKHKADLAIERFGMVYSNCGFMGIPLVSGILGNEGVFYLTAYMTVFNLIAFTHGMIIISGKCDRKSIAKSMLSPMVIATVLGFVLFICRIILPDTLSKAVNYIAAMNTPLAMMVSGVTIAQTDIVKMFTKLRMYYISLLKLLAMPIIMLLLISLFKVPRIVLLTTILACACPTAVTINLFSIKYERNYLYASEIFGLTTILSLFTIPMVMFITNLFV